MMDNLAHRFKMGRLNSRHFYNVKMNGYKKKTRLQNNELCKYLRISTVCQDPFKGRRNFRRTKIYVIAHINHNF